MRHRCKPNAHGTETGASVPSPIPRPTLPSSGMHWSRRTSTPTHYGSATPLARCASQCTNDFDFIYQSPWGRGQNPFDFYPDSPLSRSPVVRRLGGACRALRPNPLQSRTEFMHRTAMSPLHSSGTVVMTHTSNAELSDDEWLGDISVHHHLARLENSSSCDRYGGADASTAEATHVFSNNLLGVETRSAGCGAGDSPACNEQQHSGEHRNPLSFIPTGEVTSVRFRPEHRPAATHNRIHKDHHCDSFLSADTVRPSSVLHSYIQWTNSVDTSIEFKDDMSSPHSAGCHSPTAVFSESSLALCSSESSSVLTDRFSVFGEGNNHHLHHQHEDGINKEQAEHNVLSPFPYAPLNYENGETHCLPTIGIGRCDSFRRISPITVSLSLFHLLHYILFLIYIV